MGCMSRGGYPGPIGAIISPMLTGLSDGKDLPYASTLCGACKEACPVKINMPRMLLYMRNQLAEGANYPEHKTAPFAEAITFKLWRFALSSSFNLRFFSGLARLLCRNNAQRRSHLPVSS